MRTAITSLAHALRRTGLSWAAAMKRAWATIKLRAAIADRATGFWYRKEDGTERYALGFNRVAPATQSKPSTAVSLLVITYFDLLANDWRSFRADRLILD